MTNQAQKQLPDGWREVKLGEVVGIRTGKLDSNHAIENGKYPFFTCSPYPLRINDYAYDEMAVLLAGNNANGIFHVNKYNGRFNAYQRTYIITKNNIPINLDFIFYILKTLHTRLESLSQGTATKFLTMKLLTALKIKLPPLPEQKAIAHILGSLDDKIELNHQMNQTLEDMAQALFKSWFVDFDPVIDNAIITGNPIPEPLQKRAEKRKQSLNNSTANRETAKHFPNAFEHHKTMGWIPKGWEEIKLGDIGDFFGGVTSIKKTDYGHGYPFLSYKNVFNNPKVDIYNLGLMNVKDNDLKKRNCIYGDIFFTASSEIAEEIAMSSVLLDKIDNLTYNGFCKRYRLKNFNTLLPEFAQYLFREKKFRKVVYLLSTGDTRFNISQETLSNISMKIPPISLQKQFAHIVNSLSIKESKNSGQTQTLTQLRDTLLPKLISGKIRITDAEKMAEELSL